LSDHGVAYVVTGSTAVMLHGVELSPGDLDITPAIDPQNLARLATALASISASPDPDAPFGDWQTQPDGERQWVARDARPGERDARRRWQPDRANPSTFDTLLTTSHGALDVVPEVVGRYSELVTRAIRVNAFGTEVMVESVEDLLGTLTIPRRAKDRDRVVALRRVQRARAAASPGPGSGSDVEP
jgi:hypothetical protein